MFMYISRPFYFSECSEIRINAIDTDSAMNTNGTDTTFPSMHVDETTKNVHGGLKKQGFLKSSKSNENSWLKRNVGESDYNFCLLEYAQKFINCWFWRDVRRGNQNSCFNVRYSNPKLALYQLVWIEIKFHVVWEYARTLPKFTSTEISGKVTFQWLGIKEIKILVC